LSKLSSDSKNAVSFRLPCARAPRRWPEVDQEGFLLPSVLRSIDFRRYALSVPESQQISCKRPPGLFPAR
jgi:hypothetical protein